MFLALELYKPIVLICFLNFFSPSLIISWGFFAILKSSFVALFTDTSVDWADNMTDTKKLKLLIYFNSDFGFG